ncbi:hypothetical protein EQG49_12620 [Periweissella cryptocerci]|uniref:Uncharacterized protein n=1 Tax=Periweissella cryptocerci TaxID=2506420 RepID=A0A4P6YWQ9_9LACO|nr:hypothetical protein [Periweissella cryptocerci]QBO37241.1 hypothetical protein EQG49_12620 [Periweissella cryptocerci]
MPETLQINDLSDIISSLPSINSDATYWFIRAQSGDYFTDFVTNQYVGIGFDEISLADVKNTASDKDKLKIMFQEKKPKDSKGNAIPVGTFTSWVGQLTRFANDIKPGDYVLVPSKSSERFALGVVTGDPFEITKQQLEEIPVVQGRQNSPFLKRLKVQFLKQFNREQADPALYRMIYTQQTLSKINKYIPYILRAAYDAYVSNNQLYLTFHVNQKEDINGRAFTGFTYNLVEAYGELIPDSDPIIKSNVQSEGDVQLVLAIAPVVGLLLLTLIVLHSKKGFTFKAMLGKDHGIELTKEDDGVVGQRVKGAETKRLNEELEAKDAHIARMLEFANKAGMNMDSIQASISKELSEAIKKASEPNESED